MKKQSGKRVKFNFSDRDLEQVSLILAQSIIRKAIDRISPIMIYQECREFVNQITDAISVTMPASNKKKKPLTLKEKVRK